MFYHMSLLPFGGKVKYMTYSYGFQTTRSARGSFDTALSYNPVQDSLEALTKGSRIDHIGLSIEPLLPNGTAAPFFWCTLSGPLIGRYMRLSLTSHNPIRYKGFTSSRPFFWTDLWSEENGRPFLQDAAEHGIGPSGYSVPLRNP